ncbi:hypothetical protein AMJ86_02430 [bacterium SM23_57]|nr:MAG: hypothetical protein AMJ86_02430 [bacterium SM23_57]
MNCSVQENLGFEIAELPADSGGDTTTPKADCDRISSNKSTDGLILVVDDESSVRTTIKAILKKAGYLVNTAEDFRSAVELIEKNDYGVVIADIILPDASGIDVLKYVRGVNEETQLITITGDPNIDTAADAVRAGAYDYITKPIRRDIFLAVIKKAAEKAKLLRDRKELEAQNLLYQKHLEKLVEQRTEQLKASELKYRTLFEYANDSIFLLDCPSGKIVDANQQAVLMTDLKWNKLSGRPFWFLDTTSHPTELKKFCKETINKGHCHLDDVHLKIKGNKVIRADLSAKVVELGDQKQVQVLVRDVTEKKMLEEKQREMEIDLVQEQKLASIGMMASGIAHNLNTPLMGIMGLSQLMIMKLGECEEIKSIIEQANKISTIAKNLMFKSRSEAEKMVVAVDINRLLREELKFLESNLDFKHNVEKDYQLHDPLPPIQAVYSDFSQSLTNIVRNALDAMYNSSTKRLTVRTHLEGDSVLIDIIDTGCGIPKKNISQLFSPFFTTKPIRGDETEGEPTGTGLGLSSAYKLLSPYGVKFDIDSKIGKGTTFTVKIPTAQATAKNKDRIEEAGIIG